MEYVRGDPVQTSETTPGVFPLYTAEATVYNSIFEYFKILKTEVMVITSTPQLATDSAITVDGGIFNLFGWNGDPKVADLTTGALNITFPEVERIKPSKRFMAISDSLSPAVHRMAISPMMRYLNVGHVGPDANGTYSTRPYRTVRTSALGSNGSDADPAYTTGAYMPGWAWVHPQLKASGTTRQVTIVYKVTVKWMKLAKVTSTSGTSSFKNVGMDDDEATAFPHPVPGTLADFVAGPGVEIPNVIADEYDAERINPNP